MPRARTFPWGFMNRCFSWLVEQARPQWRESTWLGERGFRDEQFLPSKPRTKEGAIKADLWLWIKLELLLVIWLLVGIDVEFYYRQSWLVLNTFNWISIIFKRIIRHFIKYFRLNHQILSLLLKTPELIGMKNFSIQNRVLQRDRVLQRRVLER